MKQERQAEAFVFIQEQPLPLRYRPLRDKPLRLSSSADALHPEGTVYAEEFDYVIDYHHNLIARTADSRIPDASHHPMYGVTGFNHLDYPDYSNRNYTVYLDYATADDHIDNHFTRQDAARSGLLKQTVTRLAAGKPVKCVVFGDSISAGGEASHESLTYYQRFAYQLQTTYPDNQLSITNKSIGGEATDEGVNRIARDVISLQPNLVIIGYGMNDQNKQHNGNTVSLHSFEQNLSAMIRELQLACASDIILVTPCEPNPRWQHTSGDIHLYAEVIRRLGVDFRIGVADAHRLWREELAAGKNCESLLLNNINHPNDYGHWVYSCAFADMLKTQREIR